MKGILTDPGMYHLWIAVGAVIFLAVLYWTNKLPSLETIQKFSLIADSRGGNILILLVLTVLFFLVSIGFAYFVMDALIDQKLTQENTLALLLVNWLTGGVFGAALGALIKTLHSETK
jgi:hypothetical protein